jgi:DNA repair protein RecN (Recombination protein N)
VQIKEAALQLRRQLERLEADPGRLDWLEQRLADVHRLARKHQVRPEDLAGHTEILRAELEAITHGAEALESLHAEFEAVAAEYRFQARQLSERRHLAGEAMQARVSAIIRELGMPQGEVRVDVTLAEAEEPTAHGYDNVEFLVSANPGLPPRPLARVASGGELSRISLAIQVAAIDSKTVPTLVFDEVDSGIGGGIAEIVGQKLRLLGTEGRQVFCVTHLPQVAAQGHHHWLVEKSSRDGAAQSTVRRIDGEERVGEIARMLGGVRLTRQTLAHAEEMLGLSRSLG